jgi:hypothetical protein
VGEGIVMVLLHERHELLDVGALGPEVLEKGRVLTISGDLDSPLNRGLESLFGDLCQM